MLQYLVVLYVTLVLLKERSERGREEVDPCWMDDPKRYDDVNDVSWIHRMYRFISYDLDDVIVTCLFSLLPIVRQRGVDILYHIVS